MAHPDLDELLNAILPFAQQQLEKHGAFYPFGQAFDSAGNVKCVVFHDGDEAPNRDSALNGMVEGLRSDAVSGSIRACGICIDMIIELPEQSVKTDAICVRLEHKDGEAVHVYLPYHKGWFGRVKYGDMFAEQGDRRVFT